MKRLIRQGRQVSREVKGSNSRKKAAERLAKTHYVAIEDLNVAGMVKNHKLARSLTNSAFGEVRRQLEYKAKLYGNTVIIINRFYLSSKTCSVCNHINKNRMLSDRTGACPCCETSLDRDLNAAKNIANQAFVSYIPQRLYLIYPRLWGN